MKRARIRKIEPWSENWYTPARTLELRYPSDDRCRYCHRPASRMFECGMHTAEYRAMPARASMMKEARRHVLKRGHILRRGEWITYGLPK